MRLEVWQGSMRIREGVFLVEKYACTICGWVYDPKEGDPENGVEPGTAFADIPEDWVCPECGVDKSLFEKDE